MDLQDLYDDFVRKYLIWANKSTPVADMDTFASTLSLIGQPQSGNFRTGEWNEYVKARDKYLSAASTHNN